MEQRWIMHQTDWFRSREYAEGVRQYITMAWAHRGRDKNIKHPCCTYFNNMFLPISQLECHLFFTKIDPNYIDWIFHWEQENMTFLDDDNNVDDQFDEGYIDGIHKMLGDEDMATHTSIPWSAKPEWTTFEQLMEDAWYPLYAKCTIFSKLSIIVKFLHRKIVGGWSVKLFNMLINLLKTASPEALLPNSFQDVRSLEQGLGFRYRKMHVCPNDCILFMKENDNKLVLF